MRKMSLDEMKKIQFDILVDVARFCEENSIRYYLTYGTLLGAVRHKGYIPWDDDIDIMMPRPDYMKFLEKYNKRISNYRALSYYMDPKYPRLFTRVGDLRTRLKEKFDYENEGVSIDVFPLDGIPKYGFSIYSGIIMVLRSMLQIHYLKSVSNKSVLKKCLTSMIAKMPFCLYQLCLNIEDYLLRFSSYDNSEKVALLIMLAPERREVFEKATLEKNMKFEFEGNLFSIPYVYDSVLKILYGDYMQLPPECERVSKHLVECSVEAFYKE
ncbi:LicD family protein [Parabacteroides goldsteinii]